MPQAEIAWFDRALDEAFARRLLGASRQALAEGAFDRSNATWQPRIVLSSAPVLVRDSDAFVLEMLMRRGVIDHADFLVMNYAWGPGSYIPWHEDGHAEVAVTVYLNERWEPNWGGLFLYRTAGEEVHGHFPRFNCALRNGANVVHATTPVGAEAEDYRFTLQLFSRRIPAV